MLTKDDLIDLFVAGLAKAGPAGARALKSPAPGPGGRPFLSAYDIKRKLTAGGNRLIIPRRSIVSLLALEELTLRGVEIVREGD